MKSRNNVFSVVLSLLLLISGTACRVQSPQHHYKGQIIHSTPFEEQSSRKKKKSNGFNFEKNTSPGEFKRNSWKR